MNRLSIIMYFTAYFPNWDSLDSVRLVHSRLELWSIVFFALLALAEAIAHKCQEGKRKDRIDTVGIIFFVIAVLCEALAYPYGQRNDELSEKVIISLDQRANDALTASGGAVTKANQAKDTSTAANLLANGAMTTASGALREANAYARDIASAKEGSAVAVQKAADAVSRLADAEKRLADSTQQEAAAEAKLSSIKTPRSIVRANELIAILKPLKGTEYTLNVFQDDESIQFTKSLDEVLREAGWLRRQHGTYHLGVASFNIFKDDTPNHDESVPVCVETGIQIHVRSTKSLQSLMATPATDLPSGIRNAATLRGALQGSIAPNEERNVGERLTLDEANTGEGPMVICVGKKP